MFKGTSTITIRNSYNVSHLVDVGTGSYKVYWAIPFKADYYPVVANSNARHTAYGELPEKQFAWVITADASENAVDIDPVGVVAFGELENE